MSTTGSPRIRPARAKRIRALIADVEARTGVRGTLLARSDDPSTWMETYAPVTRAAAFRRVLDLLAQEHEAAALTADGERHVEAIRRRCRSLPARRGAARRDSVRPRLAMCLALIAFAAHPRYRWSSPPIATSSMRVPRRRPRGGTRASSPDAISRQAARGSASTGAAASRFSPTCASLRGTIPRAPSRGALVPNVLTADASPSVSLPALVRAGALPQRLQPDRRRCRRAPVGLEPRGRALVMRSAPESMAFRITCWTRRGPRSMRTKEAFRRWCEGDARADDPAAILRAPARHRAGSRRRAAGNRRHARTGADAFAAVHRQRGLRHALLDRPDDRSRGQCAASSSALSTRRETPPARSNSASR